LNSCRSEMSILNLPIIDFYDQSKLPKHIVKQDIKFEELVK